MIEMEDNTERSGTVAGARSSAPASPRRGLLTAIALLLIVALVVVAGIVPRLKARAALAVETRELAIPTVSVIHAKLGAPQSEIVVPGNMQAFMDAPIYARTSGYLKKWYVDIGAHVKSGQLLAEIETPEVDQQLEQARADLTTAIANLTLSEITAKRYEGLKNTDSVSKQDVDNAEGDYQAKKAMVASAQSNVKRLEELQSFEKIYAPFDGVITARNTDVGHLINSGAGAPATELFHMASTKILRVYVNVPQQYSQSAKPGLAADLTLQEFPGRRFAGRLVRTADSIDLTTRTLLVEVDVNNPTGELLPGAYTEVHLKVPSGAPSFILPVTALVFRSQGTQVAVVQDGNRAELRNVTIGRDYGAEVEIVSGLSENDSIIVSPPDSLVSGETVRVASGAPSQGSQPAAAPSESPSPRADR
ncbi:MAG TPA: efflux RND transporter periplasmic adaptor subunit [Candidatus Acidoferrum sp.]|nr:efflux RND transporter periplasmic adaptor subunit [Candidatus Acidoferrum sp.]